MNYNLYIAAIDDTHELMGGEIQPPISDKAFDGIKAMLTHEVYSPIQPLVVELTRNDADGTAFAFHKGFDRDGAAAEDPFGVEELQKIGQRVVGLLDPAKLHVVDVHYPETNPSTN